MLSKLLKTNTVPKNSGEKSQKVVFPDFDFNVPTEAPIFEPTPEEFEDPLAYIRQIRPIAEKSGICKIKPPPNWQPPFAVDVDKFKFTPRIQRLNELEAKTRIKLNFLDQIAKFWELQGSSLKIPVVEKRALDLYSLHQLVQDEGGGDILTKERKWSKIAMRMGLPTGKHFGPLLKMHYDRILYPYDVFQLGKGSEIEISLDIDKSEKRDRYYTPHSIPSRQAIKPPPEKYCRRSQHFGPGEVQDADPQVSTEDLESNENKELRRLQFYGAGPKMAGFHTVKEEKPKAKARGKKSGYDFDPLAKYICRNCGRGDVEESMLLCDGCDDSYHTFCLLPPLSEIPKGDWRCPKCVAEEVSKPMEAFGFEQAQREYTLQQFGEMADQFKSDYFNMPVHLVPGPLVEKEFWRIVSSIDEDVTVEYGADLHTMDHGSGFPTNEIKDLHPIDKVYADSGWNLNNLPLLEGSVLGHINADISGMKVPWMYVGMCFATFCWHNEDHWSYSINYLHWGEPKTWYGVPGTSAESFEASMKKAAPELFDSQPDLLHQLVTIMNPNILMKQGVPVCRTDQKAGEFVITFPRAYHAGFNQGYNFAEAVNFAPADWLKMGRECVSHYSLLHRFCVFSHDELVCKMAGTPNALDHTVALASYQDMVQMVDTEKKLRKSILEWGVTDAEREAFELLPDDERQCEFCKTTCFLSGVTCCCNSEHLVCLRHYSSLCDCPSEKHTLRYRYTLDELQDMLLKLQVHAKAFEKWTKQLEEGLAAKGDAKLDLSEMKELLQEAEDKKFPNSELIKVLAKMVQDAEKCVSVAALLAANKMRTRTRQSSEGKYKLTIEELTLFHEHMESLPCHMKEEEEVKELVNHVKKCQSEALALLSEELPDSKELTTCLEYGIMLDIDLPEIPRLKQMVELMEWLEAVQNLRENPEEVTLDCLRLYLKSGVLLPPHPALEKSMAELQELLNHVERWEDKAKLSLVTKSRQPISTFEGLLKEADDIPAFLPSVTAIRDALKKGNEWNAKADMINDHSSVPYVDTLDSFVTKGRNIPIRLERLPQFESLLSGAKLWKERTARTFLRKNSYYTLMEAISPRFEIGIPPSKQKKRKVRDETVPAVTATVFGIALNEDVDSATVVAAFKKAEQFEMEAMRKFRLDNIRKRMNDTGDTKYCTCRREMFGVMLNCELCKDLFHSTCMPNPKSASIKSKQQSSLQQLAAAINRDAKFLCPCCMRSRRPRVETILSLLVTLQKLPVKMPEGEALQCLTERAMHWQDRARQALATDEVATALAKLSVLSQKLVEAAAREKTEKIISSELKKAASNPDLHRRMQVISSQSGVQSEDSFGSQTSPSQEGDSSGDLDNVGDDTPKIPADVDAPDAFVIQCKVECLDECTGELTEQTVNGLRTSDDEDSMLNLESAIKTEYEEEEAHYEDPTNPYSNYEHAYSSASKQGLGYKKHVRKTPLVPRHFEPPVLSLSDTARNHLEELVMEGDLLEVSLDETQHIWRILQATKARNEEKFSDFEELDAEELDGKKLDKQKPKRKFRKRVTDSNECANNKKLKVRLEKEQEEKEGIKKMKEKKKLKDFKELSQKKIKRKDSPEKKKSSRVKKTHQESSEDEEDCAAPTCLRPTGDEVNWVQCDGGCDKWFHLHCLGLNLRDINEDEDYFCKKCSCDDEEEMDLSKVKPEPPNMDESMGLDGLLSLANGSAMSESTDPLAVDSADWGACVESGYGQDLNNPVYVFQSPSLEIDQINTHTINADPLNTDTINQDHQDCEEFDPVKAPLDRFVLTID